MKAIVQDEYGSPGMKHHRVVVTRHGGPDVLQVLEEDLPEPGAGEVRVKVLAAGVSAYDLMDRRYSFPGGPSVPYTPGQDIVGVVDKLGVDAVFDPIGGARHVWVQPGPCAKAGGGA